MRKLTPIIVPVQYAGEVTFASGKTTKGSVTRWSNASGHYKPDAKSAGQMNVFPQDKFMPDDFNK